MKAEKLIQDLIDDEQESLEETKKELESLKLKWIKLNSTQKAISFLEIYCKLKNKFMEELINETKNR